MEDNSKYYFVRSKGDQAYPLVDILNMSQVELGNTDTLKAEFSERLSKPVMVRKNHQISPSNYL